VSDADRERWDERYAGVTGVEPAPPEPLRGREDLLPKAGRALDVACGSGGTAVWLAQHRLAVDAVDVSPTALAAGETLASRCGVQVRWRAHDLDDGLPEGYRGPYDLVVCQRFRAPALYAAVADAVAPGGLLAITVLSAVGTGDGPYRAAPGELPAAFAGLEPLAHAEGDGLASLLARRVPRERGTARGLCRVARVMSADTQQELSPTEWVRKQTEHILASGTTDGVQVNGKPVVLVRVRGARTGKLRLVPLMRVEHEGAYAIVASKGGAPDNPVWYANIKTNPDVTVQDGTETRPYTARELEGDERAQWWERAVAAYPPYADYQRKTDRLIPVFVLELA